MDDPLSCDDFLGGRLRLWQPVTGYRAGVDPVVLAAGVPAKQGDSVLELGCGVGTASLCLAARVGKLELVGLEIQPAYADLARRNAQENGIVFNVVTGDLADMPAELKERRFDHVIANPPYFNRLASTSAQEVGRERSMGETLPLETWVKAAAKRCAPRGYVSFIHRAERLPELLQAMNERLGALQVLPLIPRIGRPANLVLIRGRMGARADFRLMDGILLHDGAAHMADRENYTATMTSVLREGAALPFPT